MWNNLPELYHKFKDLCLNKSEEPSDKRNKEGKDKTGTFMGNNRRLLERCRALVAPQRAGFKPGLSEKTGRRPAADEPPQGSGSDFLCVAHRHPVECDPEISGFFQRRTPVFPVLERSGVFSGVMAGRACGIRGSSGHSMVMAERRRMHDQSAPGAGSGGKESHRPGEKMAANAICSSTPRESRCRWS